MDKSERARITQIMVSIPYYLRVGLCLVLTLLYPLTVYGSSPDLIQKHDEGTVRTVLADEVPDLVINTVTLVSAGWDNLVADINGEWIFRFPRKQDFLQTLEREILLLECLRHKVSMPIPRYEYIGLHTAFVGYHKILGGALNEKLYLGCSIESRQQIAESIALFLSQFHRAVNIEEALQWGYRQYRIPLQWIEYNLLGTLPTSQIERIVNEALTYAKQNLFYTKNQVLLHNDLHGENLAFNMQTEQVTGIFDFSDAAIGNYSVDFGKLFTIHPDLAIRASKAYARLNEVADPIIPAAADYILRRALYVLYTREDGDISREANLMRMLDLFVPIWDDLQNNN